MATAKKKTQIRVIKGNKGDDTPEVNPGDLSADNNHLGMELGGEEAPLPYIATSNSTLNELLDKGSDAIKDKDQGKLLESLTDLTRLRIEIEADLAAIKKDLSSQIARIRAVNTEIIQTIEDLTHTWVFDHKNGIAYLVHNTDVDGATIALGRGDVATVNELAKRTRPMAPEDSQQPLAL